jgi:hypothetical protein
MATHRDRESDDIHAIAERFLQEHLKKNGSNDEPLLLSVVGTTQAQYVESRAVAEEFLMEHRKKTQTRNSLREVELTQRFEIEAPHLVILARCIGNVTSYFYGWKALRPLFTYSQYLAQVVDGAASEELVRTLRKIGVEAMVEPAPELRRGHS